jgi:hypothetical protein
MATEGDDSRPRRRWFRYSLRTLLAGFTLVCLVLGLIVSRAERQRRAVEAVRDAGGWVTYDLNLRVTDHGASTTGPEWLTSLLGIDYYCDVVEVGLPKSATDAVFVHLAGLTRLRKIYLSRSQVTDAGLRHLRRLTRLEELYLDGTRVTDDGLAHLGGLETLQDLVLEGTTITDAGLVHLGHMADLQWLVLSDTQVTDAGMSRLEPLGNLRVLYLDETSVSDQGLVRLRELNNLRSLYLVDTRVTDSGCRQLQAALPACDIHRQAELQP